MSVDENLYIWLFAAGVCLWRRGCGGRVTGDNWTQHLPSQV